jgi:hypothetical protein
LIQNLEKNYKKYGFENKESADFILNLDIYQVGSMVVKTEDYRIFIDGNGKILDRKENQNDSINLINACGIRSFHNGRDEEDKRDQINQSIMKETFKTSLLAASNGYIVFPAVGNPINY